MTKKSYRVVNMTEQEYQETFATEAEELAAEIANKSEYGRGQCDGYAEAVHDLQLLVDSGHYSQEGLVSMMIGYMICFGTEVEK